MLMDRVPLAVSLAEIGATLSCFHARVTSKMGVALLSIKAVARTVATSPNPHASR